jgi:hypothetical protein
MEHKTRSPGPHRITIPTAQSQNCTAASENKHRITRKSASRLKMHWDAVNTPDQLIYSHTNENKPTQCFKISTVTSAFKSISQIWSLLLNNTSHEEENSFKKPAVNEAGP